MDLYVILLRIVHIFAGVFWVGGGVMLFGFLEPTADQVGELTRLNELLSRLSKSDFVLLTLAQLAMATARY